MEFLGIEAQIGERKCYLSGNHPGHRWFQYHMKYTAEGEGVGQSGQAGSSKGFWTENYLEDLGLVAEPARPAEAEAGCLSGPAGLGGITSLVIIPEIETPVYCIAFNSS